MTSPMRSLRARARRGLPALGLSVVLGLAVPVSPAGAQTEPPDDVAASSPRRVLEVNVTNSPNRDNGQPVVAVDPQDPDNLVFVSTDHRPGTTPDKYHCFVAWSMDRGQTWSEVPWPYGDRSMCGDPYLAVDSDGTFYVAFNRLGCPPGVPNPNETLGSCNGVPNHVGVARSLDGGRTWSEPVDTPLFVASTPRLRVDPATDRVYAVGGLRSFSPHAVSVSADHGLTWGATSPLPHQPFGNQIAVHDGILASATALEVVDGQVVPTEPTFQVSIDGGQSFTSSRVTDSEGAPVPPPEGSLVPSATLGATDPVPWVSADPTHPGRFAVMLPRGDDLEVYLTRDAGRTWTGPSVIAAPSAVKPWMEFGPTGLLGVMWRTSAVDAYSVVSFDRGRSFSSPLKVNRTTQPPGDGQPGGDEWSRIVLDHRYAYVTWSDARSGGGIDGIVSRVPVSRYRGNQGP
jgi:hypothetical protein